MTALAIEIATSVALIGQTYYYGKDVLLGPILGNIATVLWWYIVISEQMWGLLPMQIVITPIHAWNLWKWRKRDLI